MAEPFKNLINRDLIANAAAQLARVRPRFDAKRFVDLSCAGLATLEMKARAMHVCDALEATLPDDFAAAIELLESALAPAETGDAMAQLEGLDDGLRGWILWPVGEYVARRGRKDPARALLALHAITQRFTAEFAIRPFLIEHPEITFATLKRWCDDPSHHVRRLVSEGSRPRLPWGSQLKSLIADPSPTLPLLRALQDDPSEYVRRSVANHLNDIGKDHPAIVERWLQDHLPTASHERRALLRHASRSLIKAGHPGVLRAFGLGKAFRGTARLTLSPARLELGEVLTIGLELESTAASPQLLAIDYIVHHVRADGSLSPKVFKGWQLTLPARAVVTLQKRHAIRPITTRRYYAGRHELTVQANGKQVAAGQFVLRLP